MRLLAISGSLRAGSHNGDLLRAAELVLPDGVEFAVYDGLREVPPFSEDDESNPPATVRHWRAAIAAADGLLIATPEYNHSLPGQLKNALDWASRPTADNVLRNRPVAVIGASRGAFGAVWAQAEGRKVLAASGARVIDRELPVPYAHEAFDGDGHLRDPELRGELEATLRELAEAMSRRGEAALAAA